MQRQMVFWLLASVILTAVSFADAQPAGKIYRIAFLSGGFPGPSHWTAKLRAELQRIGYVEGRNLAIESRFTENKIDRLPAFADELVRLKPDVIATGGINDARAAKNATKTIPIVGLGLGDPVANGLVESLARPGGNLTGFTTIVDELAGKRLELLKETIPKLTRVALLWNSQFPDSARASKLYQATAKELNLQLHSMEVTSPEKFEAAFKEAIKSRSQALAMTAGAFIAANLKRIADVAAKYRLPAISDRAEFVDGGGLMSYGAAHRTKIAELAVKSRLPAIYTRLESVEAGGLMSYGVNLNHLDRRAATYVDKILKGTKPADIPVEQPIKFEFVINLKAAKQIALTIPQWTLMKADRVIK